MALSSTLVFTRYQEYTTHEPWKIVDLEPSPVDKRVVQNNELSRKSFDEAFSDFSDRVTNNNYTQLSFPDPYERLCVAEGMEIPHSILRGPWTEESVRYLFLIMNFGGRVNWTTSTTGEVSKLTPAYS